MDLCCAPAKSIGLSFRNSFSEKPISCNSINSSFAVGIRLSRNEPFSNYCRQRSVSVRATGNNSSSFSSSAGDNEHLKAGGDDAIGNNPPTASNNSGDSDTSTQRKPLDWREFRALHYLREQAEKADFVHKQDQASLGPITLPLKWAHPITAPENGCLLIATEKLDGVSPFERSVVLLLRSGTRNPQEGPFGVVINRPLHKKMAHASHINAELSSTFGDCPLHFGGPLDASMFLLTSGKSSGLSGFEEIIPDIYFGSRTSLDKALALIKKGALKPQDFRFFNGYSGWLLDQLRDEIESDYWHLAACSTNLISGVSQNSSSRDLWVEILQLMKDH